MRVLQSEKCKGINFDVEFSNLWLEILDRGIDEELGSVKRRSFKGMPFD